MNQYVVYTSNNHAWLQSDDVSGKLARAVNMSGTRLIRGWDEVIKFQKGAAKAKDSSRRKESISDLSRPKEAASEPGTSVSAEEQLPKAPEYPEQDEDIEEDRTINHLVFIIHGCVFSNGFLI